MKSILAMFVMLAVSSAYAAPVTYKVDAATSKVNWLGKKVTGQHDGTIAVKGGEVTMDGKKITGGTITIDMKTIKVLDIKDAEYNKKLTDHLNSDDFFSTAKHGEAKLVIKSAKEVKNQMEITADLTIKNITKPVTFMVDVKADAAKATAKGKLVIERTQFDVKYGSGKFFQNLGDKMINDDFELTFDIVANK
ncbi:MAG: YceI family protein [Bdellovibrionia bacterium]